MRSLTRSYRWSASRRASRSGAVEVGDSQVLFSQRGSGHREGINGVGLALVFQRAPGPSHELGRHPHHVLARNNEVVLPPA